MTTEKLFEDYDPDMEDVFGRSDRLAPRRIAVTEEQKMDPLRKPKVVLNSILVAEKLPVTAKHIEARMIDEDGKVMDSKIYGFATLDELLQACSDTVIHYRTKEGAHVYAAKANEATQDILEMVQQQTDRGEGRPGTGPKSMYGTGSRVTNGAHGSSFRAYNGPRVQTADEASNLIRGNSIHFQERAKLGPAKSAARVHNLADVLRAHRSEIGIAHPDKPGQLIVTLSALDRKFREKYALPVWGKHMSEAQLHEQLAVPEYAGILKFWQLRPDGDIYVEEGELGSARPPSTPLIQPLMATPVVAPKTFVPSRPSSRGPILRRTANSSLNQTTTLAPRPTSSAGNRRHDESSDSGDYSSIDGSTSSNLLLEDKCDGFFESGPGFGGNMSTGAAPVTPRSIAPATSATALVGLAERFGAPVTAEMVQMAAAECAAQNAAAAQKKAHTTTPPKRQEPPAPPASLLQQQSADQQDSSYGFSSDDEISDDEPPQERRPAAAPATATSSCLVPSQRPVDPSFTSSRSIVARNPLKIIADYIKSRGSATYDSLPDDDKTLVNFSASVFKVFATQPGEMLVRLHDAHLDTTRLQFNEKDLRAPVEADLRWMAAESAKHLSSLRGQRVLVKPVMFVAPRGFLMVLCPAPGDEKAKAAEAQEKMETMEAVLRAQMSGGPNVVDLGSRKIRPGQAAVYIYREEHDVRYLRVLVLGKGATDGDVLVLLVDHSEMYCVDVLLTQLFPLPDRCSFKNFRPNCVFSTLHGVQGMAEEEQAILWKIVDDEERKRQVLGVFTGEKSMILTVDMVWKNERGQLEWLSRIAKRRGAIMSSGCDDAVHLTKNVVASVMKFGGECYMEFDEHPDEPVRGAPGKIDSPEFHSELLGPSPAPAVESVAAPSNSTKPSAEKSSGSIHSPRSFDLYAVFEKAAAEHNYSLMVCLVQFVRNSLPTLDEKREFEQLLAFMLNAASQTGVRL